MYVYSSLMTANESNVRIRAHRASNNVETIAHVPIYQRDQTILWELLSMYVKTRAYIHKRSDIDRSMNGSRSSIYGRSIDRFQIKKKDTFWIRFILKNFPSEHSHSYRFVNIDEIFHLKILRRFDLSFFFSFRLPPPFRFPPREKKEWEKHRTIRNWKVQKLSSRSYHEMDLIWSFGKEFRMSIIVKLNKLLIRKYTLVWIHPRSQRT